MLIVRTSLGHYYGLRYLGVLINFGVRCVAPLPSLLPPPPSYPIPDRDGSRVLAQTAVASPLRGRVGHRGIVSCRTAVPNTVSTRPSRRGGEWEPGPPQAAVLDQSNQRQHLLVPALGHRRPWLPRSGAVPGRPGCPAHHCRWCTTRCLGHAHPALGVTACPSLGRAAARLRVVSAVAPASVRWGRHWWLLLRSAFARRRALPWQRRVLSLAAPGRHGLRRHSALWVQPEQQPRMPVASTALTTARAAAWPGAVFRPRRLPADPIQRDGKHLDIVVVVPPSALDANLPHALPSTQPYFSDADWCLESDVMPRCTPWLGL